MMHKCVKCGETYELPPVENGCACGSKVFLYVRGEGKVHVSPDGEGKYDLDLKRLLLGNGTTPQAIPETEPGVYAIDLPRLMGAEPLKEKQ